MTFAARDPNRGARADLFAQESDMTDSAAQDAPQPGDHAASQVVVCARSDRLAEGPAGPGQRAVAGDGAAREEEAGLIVFLFPGMSD